MKIISKIKDYYDYLQGVYGIDEKVCYDRRDITNIDPSRYMDSTLEYWFKRDYKPLWCYRKEQNGAIPSLIGLEVGYFRYVFSIFRGKDYDKFEYELKEKKKIAKTDRVSPTPINLYGMHHKHWYWDKMKEPEYVASLNRDGSGYYTNPILAKTFITGLIPAEEMWENLYEYITSLNEVEIIDNRSDVQKAESHGFDRKTSFRNM